MDELPEDRFRGVTVIVSSFVASSCCALVCVTGFRDEAAVCFVTLVGDGPDAVVLELVTDPEAEIFLVFRVDAEDVDCFLTAIAARLVI